MAVIQITPITPGEVVSELSARGYFVAPEHLPPELHVPHVPPPGFHVPEAPHVPPPDFHVPEAPHVPPPDFHVPEAPHVPPPELHVPEAPHVPPPDFHVPEVPHVPPPDFHVPEGEPHVPPDFPLHIPVEQVMEESAWIRFIRFLPYLTALIPERHIIDVRSLK